MINLKLLKQDKEKIKEMILSKDPGFDVDALILMHERYTVSGKEISDLQEKINKLSDYRNQSTSLEAIKEEVKEIKATLLAKTKAHEKIEKRIFFGGLFLSKCTNGMSSFRWKRKKFN